MAFKLRLQIFFLILTVVPLLVGGWMIQRTVIDSKRSAVDQRLATGVGTLGSQYADVLGAGRRALNTVPRDGQLQRAIVEHDNATVRTIAENASGSGLVITVQDPSDKYLTPPPTGLQEIGPTPGHRNPEDRDGQSVDLPERSDLAARAGRRRRHPRSGDRERTAPPR